MPLTVTPLTADFCAEISGVDVTRPLDDAAFAEIRAAFDRWSVLILPGQPLDDAQQIAFSEKFGPLGSRRTTSMSSACRSGLDGRSMPETSHLPRHRWRS